MAKMHEKAMKEESKDTKEKPPAEETKKEEKKETPADPKAAADKLVKE